MRLFVCLFFSLPTIMRFLHSIPFLSHTNHTPSAGAMKAKIPLSSQTIKKPIRRRGKEAALISSTKCKTTPANPIIRKKSICFSPFLFVLNFISRIATKASLHHQHRHFFV